MEDNVLLKIALSFSIIGIVILYFISGNIEAESYTVPKASVIEGDFVKVEGIVSKISEKDGTTFIELMTQSPVNIVAFGDVKKISDGDYVEVFGKTSEYRGEEEVIASKIRIVRKGNSNKMDSG